MYDLTGDIRVVVWYELTDIFRKPEFKPFCAVVISEGYTKKSYLGIRALSNCLHAKYSSKHAEDFQVFVLVPSSGKTVTETWSQLSKKWKPIKHQQHEILIKDIPYRGPVGLVRTPRGILGVSTSSTEEETIKSLERLAKQKSQKE